MTAATAVGDGWTIPAGSARSDWLLAFLLPGNDDVTSIVIRGRLRVGGQRGKVLTPETSQAVESSFKEADQALLTHFGLFYWTHDDFCPGKKNADRFDDTSASWVHRPLI